MDVAFEAVGEAIELGLTFLLWGLVIIIFPPRGVSREEENPSAFGAGGYIVRVAGFKVLHPSRRVRSWIKTTSFWQQHKGIGPITPSSLKVLSSSLFSVPKRSNLYHLTYKLYPVLSREGLKIKWLLWKKRF